MLHVRLRESTFVVGNASAGESARRKPRSPCDQDDSRRNLRIGSLQADAE